MSSSRHSLHIAVLAFLLATGFGRRTVIIPEAASAIEHAPLRLDCLYKDTITVTQSVCRWSVVGNGTTTAIGIFYDDCLFINLYEETYTFECANKTATSMIIKSTDRKLHGTVISCSYFVNSVSTTDTVTILISVPVSSIKLTEPEIDVITTTENATVTFICNASAAHPKPRIVWFSDSQTPLDYRDDIAITNTVTEISDSDGYLYTVMSNMTFYPRKYDNGSHIYCNASNTEEHIISSKRKALLNVQYPPSSPIFFMRSNVTVKNVAIIINKTLKIRCKSNGNPFPNYKWTNTQKKVVSGEELYIDHIKKADDGTYSCMAYNTFTTEGEPGYHNTSASIEVTVLFPPDSPKLFYLRPGITEQIAISTLKVIKGDNISVHCNSTGKPRPVSVWNGTESSDLLFIRSIGADVNNTCTSSNLMIETAGVTKNGLESRVLTIIALYPPSTPIIKTHLSGDIVEVHDVMSVIENTNILLECSAESKPHSTFTWSRPVDENLKDPSKQLFVNRMLRNQSGTYTCHATNEMVRSFGDKEIGKNDRSIYVVVLYSPDTPNFYYLTLGQKQKIHTLPLKVVERDNVSVFCNSTGNPSPKTVWMESITHKDTFSIVSIEIQHQINITCKAFNMMNDTFGVSENGTSSKNLSIIVLYPPRNLVIHIQLHLDSTREALNYTGILEGSDFSLYCNAVSNPSPSYKWTGPVTSNHKSTSEELFVSNIQRNQSGPYICYAQNEMERSFGNTETGRNNQSIYFDILYQAVIKYFGAADFQNNKNMMTVDQGEDKRVICKAESNPFANNTIFFKGRIVNETIRSDTVFYSLLNTSCSDAGRYICKGKNEYNYKTDASKELFVYVKCPPQPSADQPPEKNISVALTGSALFRFHAAPYFDPGITHFRWFKQGNDSQYFLRNGTKTYISSSDIHTFLRIDDVSEVDYVMYILEYNNSFGTNNFTFYLQQKDQTISENIHQSKDKLYLPIVIGIVTAVLVIFGITLGILIYIRRNQKKTDTGNRSYDNICGMNAKSSENTSISSPVYEGLKPIDERGYVEMKEQAYDILTPKDSVETNDPVYTNLKL